jgi:hypothetical protein
MFKLSSVETGIDIKNTALPVTNPQTSTPDPDGMAGNSTTENKILLLEHIFKVARPEDALAAVEAPEEDKHTGTVIGFRLSSWPL